MPRSGSSLPDQEPISMLGIRGKRLVPELGPQSHQAFVEGALDDAIAAGEQADRPVRAVDQPILAKATSCVLDKRKQPVRVPVAPDRFGGEARNLAPHIAAGGKRGEAISPFPIKA